MTVVQDPENGTRNSNRGDIDGDCSILLVIPERILATIKWLSDNNRIISASHIFHLQPIQHFRLSSA